MEDGCPNGVSQYRPATRRERDHEPTNALVSGRLDSRRKTRTPTPSSHQTLLRGKGQANRTPRPMGNAPAAVQHPQPPQSARPYRPSGFHATLRTVRGKTSPPTVDRQVQPAAVVPSAASPSPATSASEPSRRLLPPSTLPPATSRAPSSTPGGGAHSRTLASAPADASSPPAGDHATHHTAPVWPVRVADRASAWGGRVDGVAMGGKVGRGGAELGQGRSAWSHRRRP